MSIAQIEIQIIAVIVAITCALSGVFLVLRRMALMSDAISHAILLGIVVCFFIVRDLSSPWLIVGASLVGLLLTITVESLHSTRLVPKDAAIGLVFPALFSIGVILVARNSANVHIDTDAVLLGELAFAPFDRLRMFGFDLGPRSMYSMGIILLVNILYITLFYKELKLATFDPGLAASLGFYPAVIHYSFMSLVSVTAVGAFDSVGSVLVVALMITPACSAYLLTTKLRTMILLSIGFGFIGAIGGYWMARVFNASIAGSMATMVGLIFATVFLFAPRKGIVAKFLKYRTRHWDLAITMLLVHILNHENTGREETECNVDNFYSHLQWQTPLTYHLLQISMDKGFTYRAGKIIKLTDKGRDRARSAMLG